jgi:mercuric ion transport protein
MAKFMIRSIQTASSTRSRHAKSDVMTLQSDRSPTTMQPVAAASRKKLSARLMGVAVLSSMIASTCCVIPLILVLVGITGAWMVNLTALKPLTPVFTCIAIATISWAGYLVYRPSAPRSAQDDANCETDCDAVRPITRKIFLACAVFIALLLSFPLFAPLFY